MPSTKMSSAEQWAGGSFSQWEHALDRFEGTSANQRTALWRDIEATAVNKLAATEKANLSLARSRNHPAVVFRDVEEKTQFVVDKNRYNLLFSVFICVFRGCPRHAGKMKGIRAPLLWQHSMDTHSSPVD